MFMIVVVVVSFATGPFLILGRASFQGKGGSSSHKVNKFNKSIPARLVGHQASFSSSSVVIVVVDLPLI